MSNDKGKPDLVRIDFDSEGDDDHLSDSRHARTSSSPREEQEVVAFSKQFSSQYLGAGDVKQT